MMKFHLRPLCLALFALQAGCATAPPANTCTRQSGAVATLICRDAEVSALDRQLTEAYIQAEQASPSHELQTLRAEQQGWIGARDACATAGDVRSCVVTLYRRRRIELRIRSGQLPAPAPVAFTCSEQPGQPFTASYYNQTDPPSAVFIWGEDQVVAFQAPSGSGARYEGRQVDFWEHQGEAAIDWRGRKMICKPRD